jgi:hypothetical protein
VRLLPFSIFLAFAAVSTITLAAEDADEAALLLADSAPMAAQKSSAWRISTEGSIGRTRQRFGLDDYNTVRGSLDVYYDGIISPGWRAIFADRLDRSFLSGNINNTTINTLKEAYVSWHRRDDQIIDFGRINAHYGVGYGYNPTDFFRTSAIRSIVSIDPNTLRENRLGTAMIRGQALLSGGSITALYAPKLVDKRNNASFSPDFGATNGRNRWLISGSRQFTENFNPQVLVFGGDGQSAQLGLNLSTLITNATVGYIEWSGGSSKSRYDDSLGINGERHFRQRAAAGLTYTTSNKISLTSEFEYNGAGLTKSQWAAIGNGPVASYFQYRNQALDYLDLPTRSAAFFFATWQDAMVNHLDLKAMVRFNVQDQSRLNWLEARYHFTHADLSLQLQHNSGNRASEYGGQPQLQVIQTLLTYYF